MAKRVGTGQSSCVQWSGDLRRAARDLSIPQKLGACYAALILVVIIANVMVHFRLQDIDRADRDTDRGHHVLEAVGTVMRALVDQETALRGFVLSGEPEFLAPYHDAKPVYRSALIRAMDNAVDAAFQHHLSEIDALAKMWAYEFAEPQIARAESPFTRPDAIAISARGAGKHRMDMIRAEAGELEQLIHQDLARSRAAKNRAYRAVHLTLLTGGGLTFAVAMVAAWLLSRTIATPIAEMADRMGRLADGDLHVAIPPMERADEIGRMIRALHAFRAALEERTSLLATEREHITQLRRAQADLVEAQKLAALGQLVAGVAHELNTPIGSSLTVATALTEKCRRFDRELAQGPLRRSSLTAFIEDVMRAARLLNLSLEQAASQVINFKQVAVDQTSQQRRRFDLAQVTSQVLATIQPLYKHTTHRLDMDIPPGVLLDSFPGPYGQIITNLVVNALEHGLEGHPPGRVLVRLAERHDRLAVIDVVDDGGGMPPDVARRVFEPFFTTKRGRGGSGLGLNIVHNLVTSVMGGRIDVRSVAGEGTTVRLELPLESTQKAAA